MQARGKLARAWGPATSALDETQAWMAAIACSGNQRVGLRQPRQVYVHVLDCARQDDGMVAHGFCVAVDGRLLVHGAASRSTTD